MIFKDSNGINIFNTDDIIVSTVNNVDLPFILELGSHWNFKPYSLGMRKEANVYSNTNSAIISLGNDNNYYEPGYYDVSVRYSLDSRMTEHYLSYNFTNFDFDDRLCQVIEWYKNNLTNKEQMWKGSSNV